MVRVDNEEPTELDVVLNWFEELKTGSTDSGVAHIVIAQI